MAAPYRFLCLPGAFGSKDKFAVQLAPITKELTSDNTATFHFIQGAHEAIPPPGYEDFFGGPPFWRFLEGSSDPNTKDALEAIRDFPEGATPEETLRLLNNLGGDASAGSAASAANALKYLYGIIEKDGPFDAIIGYSEGALVAGTLLLHEHKLFKDTGRPRQFKLGLFFAGWPPLHPETGLMVLCDEVETKIEMPTCHVIGSLDPYLDGSMALYNVCDQDTAVLFDHAKGHTLPRDKETVKELGDTLRSMIADIRELEEAEAAEAAEAK